VADYVLIESRDPFEFSDTTYMYQMAGDLAANGNRVTMFLVQNGVLCARKNVKNNPLVGLRKNSPAVRVEADDFSLRERGISPSGLAEGVNVSNVDDLVDHLMQGDTKVVWH
jgi:predicted peroxiredoxin